LVKSAGTNDSKACWLDDAIENVREINTLYKAKRVRNRAAYFVTCCKRNFGYDGRKVKSEYQTGE